jgi:hypothetical protein
MSDTDRYSILRMFPWKSLTVVAATVIGPIYAAVAAARRASEWYISNGGAQQTDMAFVFGLLAALAGVVVAIRLFGTEYVQKHMSRVDTFNETLEYPLRGDRSD